MLLQIQAFEFVENRTWLFLRAVEKISSSRNVGKWTLGQLGTGPEVRQLGTLCCSPPMRGGRNYPAAICSRPRFLNCNTLPMNLNTTFSINGFRQRHELGGRGDTSLTSALGQKSADVCRAQNHVRFTPNSDRKIGFPQKTVTGPDMAPALPRLDVRCRYPPFEYSRTLFHMLRVSHHFLAQFSELIAGWLA